MPQAQVIDLTPSPRTEPTALEQTLGAFSKQNRKNQVEAQESDALRDIYAQYQNDGQNLEKTIKDIQTRPGISPTTRVNTIDQLLKFQQHNHGLQKEAQAKLDKANEIEKGKTIIKDLETRRGLEPGSLSAYGGDYKAAEMASRPKKEPTKTQASQPIDPVQLASIQKVEALDEFKNGSPAEKAKLLRDNNVSKENITSVLDPYIKAEEGEVKANVLTRKEELKFHDEGAKIDEEIYKNLKVAKKQQETINTIEKSINTGKVGPTSAANLFKGFGEIGDKFAKAMLNPEEASIQSSIPQLLEGWKEVFGVRLTDADLKVLQDKLPDIGKTVEANRAILKIMRKYADMSIVRAEVAEQITEENGGLRPLGYAGKIEKRLDQMTAPVKMISPISGREIEIPAYKVSEAFFQGATFPDEQL